MAGEVSEKAILRWFGDPLSEDPRLTIQDGFLSSYVSHGKARAGMTNPPMCDAVRRECLQYLLDKKVPCVIKPKPLPKKPLKVRRPQEKPPVEPPRAPEPEVPEVSAIPPSLWTESGDVCGSTVGTESIFAESMALWDAEERKSQSMQLSQGLGLSHSRLSKTKASTGPSIPLWLHEVYEMQKERKPPPAPTDREFNRWTHSLDMKSYEHGRELDRKPLQDLAELNIYHNSGARQATQLWSPHTEVAELRSLKAQLQSSERSLQSVLGSLGDQSQSQSHSQLNNQTLNHVHSPARAKKPLWARNRPAPSSQYLGLLAKSLDTAGPNKLQRIAQRANVSMVKAEALPRGRVRAASMPYL